MVKRNYTRGLFIWPDSLGVRASASGSEGRGFAPRPRHTKGVKNGTGSSLADTRNKKGSTRKTQERRKVFVTRYVAVKALQSLGCLFQNAKLNKASLSLSFFI